MSSTAHWWNAVGLFLVVLWLIQRWRTGWLWFAAAGVGALILSLTPFYGHAPRYWLSGLTPNMSVPLLVLLVASIIRRASGRIFFRARDWRAAWIFGAVASFVLYPSALGLGLRNFDSYSLGWPWLEWLPSLALFGAVATVTGLLVWRGNRFGWVLLLAAVAYALRLQESHNLWDYLLDPLFAAVSLLAAGWLIWRRSERG